MADDTHLQNRGEDESLAVERAIDKNLLTKVLISGAVLFVLFIIAVSLL